MVFTPFRYLYFSARTASANHTSGYTSTEWGKLFWLGYRFVRHPNLTWIFRQQLPLSPRCTTVYYQLIGLLRRWCIPRFAVSSLEERFALDL